MRYEPPIDRYRYYAVGQLPRLNRILALKDLGFSLDQIARVLDDGLPAAEIQGMLRLKRADVQQVVASEQARLTMRSGPPIPHHKSTAIGLPR